MAIIKMTKNKVLPIILVMAIVVFTMGVIAQDDVISSSSNTEFNVFFQNPECVIVNSENRLSYPSPTYSLGQSLWVSSGNLPEDSKDNCYKKDGAEGVQKCCPTNYNCEGHNNENDKGECVSNFATTCGDHKSEEDCGNSNSDIAHIDLNPRLEEDGYGANACTESYVPVNWKYQDSEKYSKSCTYFFDCKCEWDDDEDVCKSNSNRQVKNVNEDDSEDLYPHDNLPSDINKICGYEGGGSDDDGLGVGNCAIKYTIEGDCSTGDDFVTRSWTADFQNNAQIEQTCTNTPDDCAERFEEGYYCMITADTSGVCAPNYCKPGSEVIPCERVVRLPFFSLQNIILAIILLVIIYYFILKKKKK